MTHTALLVLGLAFSSPVQHSPAQHSAQLGTVHFQTSCAPAVADAFNHAVALLHSFEYDQAQEAFADIAGQDPSCAMARWGEAMAYFHGLWGEYNAEKGAAAAAEARRLATEHRNVTPRERAYIEAISELFTDEAIQASRRPGNEANAQGFSQPTRPPQVRYTKKMAALHHDFPNDDEGTIFYAVALDTTASAVDAAQTDRHECVSLLKPLFVKFPNHPGIAHYIIHCTDNPRMAREGLDAARKYAAIAPASAHATHMPSHIFARLGLWDEMIASNRRSMAVALEHEHAGVCMKADEALHAMHYLSFALVQTGRLAEAREIVKQAAAVPGITECDSEMAIVPAAYVMETADWASGSSIPTTAKIRPETERLLWEAIGISAARSRDNARARTAEAKLASLRDGQAAVTGVPKNASEVSRLTVAAWIAHEAGERDQGVSTLRQAVELEQKLDTATAVFKPTRELLADMLLLDDKPQEALAAYRVVLEGLPNRFNALCGAASAAYASGDKELAKRYDRELVSIARGNERPELVTARKRLEGAATFAQSSPEGGRWSEERASAWYRAQPWLVGSNYIPANAINQLEMWQADTFDPVTIDKELGWAEGLGMTTMRVFLHDLAWQQDADAFRARIDRFLSIAAKHKIRPLFVLFDSVWDPNPHLGPQHAPTPGVHNSGWVQSPGANALADPAQYPRLRAYVTGVVSAFGKDPRVLGWDLWNEPDNINEGSYLSQEPPNKIDLVLALLPQVFAWAREANPEQPLTSGVWHGNWSKDEKLSPIARIQLEQSDVISFHNYDKPREFEKRIKWLQRYNRPILCTEYMARKNKSTFEGTLPIAKRYRVGAINWGFVAGKTQTYLPWDSWKKPYVGGREPRFWFHEIFRSDGTPYRQEEVEVIRMLTASR